ncbi:hypothetical protein KP79_PYT09652 [Mizuhopecten yessoensis]|uniref:Uncharacterized protein n=1 Tax=Mizuhopecten yessoensis TaxID=6573 RepID=A0A210PFA3_MIZYE|nr:hypothetical protein KP79_PYT09652 [Mizuhopecten yessoensis]
MTTEEAEVLSDLRHSLKNILDREEDILKFSRNVVKETNGVNDFVNGKISKLFGLASTYRNAFERLKVTNKKDFDKVVKKNFRHHDIQDLEQSINDTEVEWDQLLQDLDQQLQEGGVSTLSEGQEGPINVILEDARTGDTTTLSQYLTSDHLTLILLRHFA